MDLVGRLYDHVYKQDSRHNICVHVQILQLEAG